MSDSGTKDVDIGNVMLLDLNGTVQWPTSRTRKYVFRDCEICQGSGQVSVTVRDYSNTGMGSGGVYTCPECHGSGVIKTNKFIYVD